MGYWGQVASRNQGGRWHGPLGREVHGAVRRASSDHRFSRARLLATRLLWRSSPENSALSQVVTISSASPGSSTLSPIQSTFASLCSRLILAD
jgi:hypothetical protein